MQTSWTSFALGMLGCVAFVSTVQAQVSPSFYSYTQTDLEWYTLETENFNILFHHEEDGPSSSRTAQVVARVAEDVFDPITELYQYVPDSKVSIILKDFEDYSNGAAYFFDNKIEIWAPALNSPLRGNHNWLRNVIAHEFTHMVQVQKAMKADRSLPFLYFQWLDYENVKRPDVLYGYPNTIVTYPVPVLNNPAWLAEGTAQYQTSELLYDQWDAHRDMKLRTRVLAGEELTLAEMGGFFSHISLMREGVYNHGFAFTHYLVKTYGEDVLRELSAKLGKWRNWNVDRALKEVTGTPGKQVYAEWMATLRETYEAQTKDIRDHLVEGALIEPDGFSNFYPRYSPDGSKVAYISNRGEDFNLLSLYVRDVANGEVTAYELHEEHAAHGGYTCAFGHRLTSRITSSFDWMPDGKSIVYVRTEDTPKGYLYADLWTIDLDTKKKTRLTHNLRAHAPVVNASGTQIAYIAQSDGTTNLMLWDVANETTTALTTYQDGTQVTDPAWHPSSEWIYFGHHTKHGRDLYRVHVADKTIEAVYATLADERNAAFDAAGEYLYFASDASGIFNLYRMPADGQGEPERLTNVLGGAFMPDLRANGQIAYASYQWDGYKIAQLDAPQPLTNANYLAAYDSPALMKKEAAVVASASTAPDGTWYHLNDYEDADLRPLIGGGTAATPVASSDSEHPVTPADVNAKPYGNNLFTSFSFYPVYRLDEYISRRQSVLDARFVDRTRGELLWRNSKFGFYTSSREILEGMSLLGGILIGPGSRDVDGLGDFLAPTNLLKLERDVFLQFDYNKGFGFIPKRWSPQLSVELFNIRRNVENGLSIEEFPCTSCYPDTTLTDLAYSLWEANISLRSKVNRALLLEVGYRFSPYRVNIERFFSKEADQFIDDSSDRYYIGNTLRFKTYWEVMHPHRDSDVVPQRIKVEASYEYEDGRLLDRFDVEDGFLVPRYDNYGNHRFTLDTRYGLRFPGYVNGGAHGLGVRLRGSTILGKEVDDFFNDFVGGLIGARGYPFYALGGNETAWLNVSYHLPLLPRIHRQFMFTYIDKLYARVYADGAMAWAGGWPGFSDVRKDIGAELRLGIGSFYLLPTALFLSATYGLDSFDFELDDGFVTPDGATSVRYGNEWQWHFGVLFGFDL